MRVTLGYSLSAAWLSWNLRPTTLVSMPAPEMFFADCIDDEQIDFVEGQARHPFLGED